MNHREEARKMVIDFHIAIAQWFRADKTVSIDQLLSYFSEDFHMVGPGGNAMGLAAFAAWLPGAKGSRPDIVITIDNLEIFSTFHHTLAYYEEKQEMGNKTTVRRSSAVFKVEDGRLKWWQLKEEWI
ncbi:MAG: nuclear transport factor 2 family protein [Chitinophaga sp.]|uniref:DUF4440 domain-containing protein n=1 Tax=Chitinophaga sp. TaxID=1869181 RepID=UPI0025C6FA12|nr:DUF4440 domain-containing protein [Chitinophaga sp.]MBV8255276.1 nuclear transport factor 2 family protein [Chitinophaga sp.]